MFSKEDSKKIREEFYINFGKNYPHKWILYDTEIKEVQLKFTFTTDFAQVSLDVFSRDEVIHEYYFERIYSLKSILKKEYLPDLEIEKHYILPEGKKISRFYEHLNDVNIHNRNHWPCVSEFLYSKMEKLEAFFIEYKEYLDA